MNDKVRFTEKTVILTLISATCCYGKPVWQQVGADIPGNNINMWSGRSVSISSNGEIVAIGAPAIYPNIPASVSIYQLSENSWQRIGVPITGGEGEFGRCVSISSNGTYVAVSDPKSDAHGAVDLGSQGMVQVYRRSQSRWTRRGDAIRGDGEFENSGSSISISADGKTLVIGSPGHIGSGGYSGRARVFRYIDSNWQQLGSDINGEAAADSSGGSVSINSDGTIIAVGADKNNGNGENSGHVRVYEWSGSAWLQKGADIDGEHAGDRSGASVSLSADGSIVASDVSAGVRVFEWSGAAWVQKGADIHSASGKSVSVSADGQRVAFGASGLSRVYEWSNDSWQQLASDIAAGGNIHDVVSLSSDGSTVAIGAPFNDDEYENAGLVKVYEYNPNAVTTISQESQNVSVTGGSYEISITSNTNWDVAESLDWLFAAPPSGSGNGVVTITVDANATLSGRSSVIEIGGQSHTIFQDGGPDTDADGMSDYFETEIYGTNPNDADSDNDNLTDGREVLVHSTDPLDVDTDGDTILDGIEVKHQTFGFDPTVDSSARLVEFQESAAELPGVLTESQVGLMSLGAVTLNPSGANGYDLEFVIEESEDLTNWITVDTVTHQLGSSGGRKFVRVRKPD